MKNTLDAGKILIFRDQLPRMETTLFPPSVHARFTHHPPPSVSGADDAFSPTEICQNHGSGQGSTFKLTEAGVVVFVPCFATDCRRECCSLPPISKVDEK